MIAVAARWNYLDRLLLLELTEADRAEERVLPAAPLVGDDGKRAEGGGVHPAWAGGAASGLGCSYPAAGDVGGGIFGDAAGVDGEEGHEEEGGEEDEDGDGHGGVDGGGGCGVDGWRGEVFLGRCEGASAVEGGFLV